MEISLYNPEFSIIRHILPVPTSVGLGRFYCISVVAYLVDNDQNNRLVISVCLLFTSLVLLDLYLYTLV